MSYKTIFIFEFKKYNYNLANKLTYIFILFKNVSYFVAFLQQNH